MRWAVSALLIGVSAGPLGCQGALGAPCYTAASQQGDAAEDRGSGDDAPAGSDPGSAGGDDAGVGDANGAGGDDAGVGDANGSGGDTGPPPWDGPVFDTTIFIDGSLSGDCLGTYNTANRACGSGAETAYRSFASARSAAAEGVEFKIRAGTYTEVLHLDVSGRATAYVGYVAYAGEEVAIANVSSTEDGEDYGPIWLDHVSYNLVRGLTVQGSVGFLRAVDAHNNVIDRCNFNGSTLYPGASKRGGLYFSGSHHNRVLNSRVFQGTDALSFVHSDYNMVLGNTFELAGHNIFDILCSSYNVIRGNDLTNPIQKLGAVLDCESATMSWHGNGDLAQSNPVLDSAQHNLIERNVFHGTEHYYSTSGGNGIQYAGQNGIVRRNVFYETNVGLGMQQYADEALYSYGNRVYHNVFHANFCAGISVKPSGDQGRIDDNEYKNNILWNNEGYGGDCSGESPAQILFRRSVSGHRWVRNNIASAAGNTIIREEFGNEYDLAGFPGASAFEATLEVDPEFENAANHEYALADGSRMEDAGHFLTTITSATGSGTTIQLADASYFYDGFGIPGEEGDLVQVEDRTETARVIAVDYSSDVVTLDRSLSWTQGQGFGLPYDGDAPDVGAFE